MRQRCNVSQHNIEGEREGVYVFIEHRLAICKADGLHIQQRAGRIVQDYEGIQHALLFRSFLQAYRLQQFRECVQP